MRSEQIWTEYVQAGFRLPSRRDRIPFSDPMMDGPVIQEAALRALLEHHVDSICDDLVRLDTTVPLIAMTYYKHRVALRARALRRKFSSSGIRGAIIPPRPKRRSRDRACDSSDVATVLLVAPQRPSNASRGSRGHPRIRLRVGAHGRYVGRGWREGERVVRSIRRTSDAPALIGIASPRRSAKQAADVSDGVIVGSRWFSVLRRPRVRR